MVVEGEIALSYDVLLRFVNSGVFNDHSSFFLHLHNF